LVARVIPRRRGQRPGGAAPRRLKLYRRIAARYEKHAAHYLAMFTLAAGVALVRLLHEAGVPLLAGTDAGNPFVIPGFSLHTELELLVRAGLLPLAAIQAATVNPAPLPRRD